MKCNHYWTFLKEEPSSKIVTYEYEDPITKKKSPSPKDGDIVREKILSTGATYKCKKCGKEIMYCGFLPINQNYRKGLYERLRDLFGQ